MQDFINGVRCNIQDYVGNQSKATRLRDKSMIRQLNLVQLLLVSIRKIISNTALNRCSAPEHVKIGV